MKGTFDQLLLALKPLGEYDIRGEQARFDCPRCEANGMALLKKNLEINFQKRAVNCWGCSYHGNLYKLIEDFGYKEFLPLFKTEGKIQFVDEDDKKKPLFLPENLIPVERNKEALNYLIQKRHISLKKIKERKIQYCQMGKYINCIIFPSYDKTGKLNYWIGHSIKDFKYRRPAGVKYESCFYESYIDVNLPIFITEGVYDAIVIPNCIPLNGLSLTDGVRNLITNKEAVLITDEVIDSNKEQKLIKDIKAYAIKFNQYKLKEDWEDLNKAFWNHHSELKKDLRVFFT